MNYEVQFLLFQRTIESLLNMYGLLIFAFIDDRSQNGLHNVTVNSYLQN